MGMFTSLFFFFNRRRAYKFCPSLLGRKIVLRTGFRCFCLALLTQTSATRQVAAVLGCFAGPNQRNHASLRWFWLLCMNKTVSPFKFAVVLGRIDRTNPCSYNILKVSKIFPRVSRSAPFSIIKKTLSVYPIIH